MDMGVAQNMVGVAQNVVGVAGGRGRGVDMLSCSLQVWLPQGHMPSRPCVSVHLSLHPLALPGDLFL